eukprot:Plantae.Rhodophyta-Purpureofilum_apyrenoidigerum.ctg4275.p1 GENE.Plantae.Rhodophyta-Purpureofilum_apyrenoidigerum.ctg4275~~Plantae.Rhodophyta-Purpureofilum_apyrenoidigerum.ctg4275.p1  ORF type:complete len:153 (-),score=27.31 Plantae.Rhodophyta-Purpureofilum_apyrenoidigerum.ctg4275:115-573(-)
MTYHGKVTTVTTKPKRKQKSSSAGVPLRFQCEKCARMFKYDYCRRNHNRVHTNEEPYVCQFSGCTKRFKWRTSKVNHERKVHFATSDESAERLTSSGGDVCEESMPEDITQSSISEEFDKAFSMDANYNMLLRTWLRQTEMEPDDSFHIFPF